MLAVLAMLAPKRALRVAPGGSALLGPLFAAQAPPFRSMALLHQAGTGKQARQPNWKACLV